MSADLEKRLRELAANRQPHEMVVSAPTAVKAAEELAILRAENEALTEKAAALSEDCANWQRRHTELKAKLAETGRDAERLAYLTADHDDAEVRKRRNHLLCRMPVMSHSAACADIDIGLADLAAERKEEKHG